MAKLSSVASAGTAAERPVYRPLSVPALLAFVIACVYALFLLFKVIGALTTDTPFSVTMWSLLVPLASGCLAYAGRQQVRRSEGTRSGDRLAFWALSLSIVLGFGAAAHYFATLLAVRQQAGRFAMQYFDRLKQGKLVEAFLYEVDPAQRKFDKPSDREAILMRYASPMVGNRRSALLQFRDSEIARIVLEGGESVEVKSLGTKNWTADREGYTIQQNYRLFTPQCIADALVSAHGFESKEFEGRQWVIVPATTKILGSGRSPLGEKVEKWRADSADFLGKWIAKVRLREFGRAFLDTLGPEARVQAQKKYLACSGLRTMLAAAGASVSGALPATGPAAAPASLLLFVDPEIARVQILPGYLEFMSGAWLHTSEFAAQAAIRTPILETVRRQWGDPTRLDIGVKSVGLMKPLAPTEEPQTLQFDHLVQVQIRPADSTKRLPEYLIEGSVFVESDPFPLSSEQKPKWHIARIDLLRGVVPASPMIAIKAPAPGQPPGPPK